MNQSIGPKNGESMNILLQSILNGKGSLDFAQLPNESPISKAIATSVHAKERAISGRWRHRPELRSLVLGTCLAFSAEPFQGSASLVLQPRVARSSQPWAGGRNPFRIADLTGLAACHRLRPVLDCPHEPPETVARRHWKSGPGRKTCHREHE